MTSMDDTRQDLLRLLYEIDDLDSAANVLVWDQATYMPTSGAPARSRQMATLRALAHKRLVSREFARALSKFEQASATASYDSDDAALARVTRRAYDQAANVPTEFLYEFTEHTSSCFSAWADARPADNFGAIRPYLDKTLELSRRYSDFFPDHQHPADPHIDRSDFGMSVAIIRPIFADLRTFLTELTHDIQSNGSDAHWPQGALFEEDSQRRISSEIVARFGYDFSRGRLDKTHHPFMIKFSIDDCRITTRFFEQDLSGLFGTMHEAGHAMYEQGIDKAYERTPLAEGTSSAVHESQSRTWENIVGRSRGFWNHYYPELQAAFRNTLGEVPLDTFYRTINQVSPSLIRVEADEVTYGLHVIIRFELELAMLEGELAVHDLPEAWNAKYAEYLGITPSNDRDGVLQDVHWYTDYVGGMFQGYLLGNVLASQFFDAALAARPNITAEIEQGQFSTLLGWLTENVYRHGSKYSTGELAARITGGQISTEPYKRYLREKYAAIYDLEPPD
jgi:carboxypeptidase Taq